MSTKIEWTQMQGFKGETWNPVTGCTKVSPACEHCYAIGQSHRNAAMGLEKYQGVTRKTHKGLNWTGEVFIHQSVLSKPISWKKPRMIFVNSMSDTFHEKVPFEFIDAIMKVAGICQQHIFLILTKRPERMAKYFQERQIRRAQFRMVTKMAKGGISVSNVDVLPNVWLGTTIENQEQADKRIPHLLKCPSAVRFVSCEPLLGNIDLTKIWENNADVWIDSLRGKHGLAYPLQGKNNRIDWVIAGGESGHHARPMHPDWARSLRDQCQSAGVPFFFKQWGEWGDDDLLDIGEAIYDHFEFGKNALLLQGEHLYKVGKHKSGNHLDGVQHLNWPIRKDPYHD